MINIRIDNWFPRLLSTPLGLTGSIMLMALLIIVTFGTIIAPYDPEEFHMVARLASPNTRFLLGTDNYGRDVLSRILYGSRATVQFGVIATIGGAFIGSVIGLTAGFIGGRVDNLIMRGVDVFLAIPNLILILLVVTVIGTSSVNAMAAVAITFAPSFARITRGSVLSVREREFVKACIARGESNYYIMFREILPVITPPILVETSIRIGLAIMLGATLSYLGLGAQPPSSDWGLMVSNGRQYMYTAPWLVIGPGISIAFAAVSFNMLGDGLRDSLNRRAL